MSSSREDLLAETATLRDYFVAQLVSRMPWYVYDEDRCGDEFRGNIELARACYRIADVLVLASLEASQP